MIQFHNISKVFPDKTLFKELDLMIKNDSRVGLVGANGSGKTTLLKMIIGEEQFDTGSIHIAEKVTIGYLPQEISSESSKPILIEVLDEIPEIGALEQEIASLSEQVSSEPANQVLLKKLGRLQTEYDRLDGWSIESRAKKVLGGLGFSSMQMGIPLEQFSGGWRMRVALAKLLFKQPDVLLLDEPTNHLDLASLIWLENFLQEWKGALVLISHDRTFLDKVIDHIAEIHHHKIQYFAGNYTKYIEEKKIRTELQCAAYKNQQKFITETERFIERFRYKESKATQVQSRVKMLDKLERIPEPEAEQKKISVRIPQPGRSARILAEFKNTSKSYGPINVFHGLNLAIERGQKIGLVGPNGAGKSTLLKMLAGTEPLSSGQLLWGSEVTKSYFAQHQFENLPMDKTIYDLIEEENPKWTMTQIRSYLGSFLFSGDTIDKQLKVLSGGEISRLALAKMLATPAHLILLDEPTNHLDVSSRDIVQDAISGFEGSMVCISHDRYFLNKMTDTIIEVDGGAITLYPGNYDYYIWKKSQEIDQPVERLANTGRDSEQSMDASYAERKRQSNRLKKLPMLIEDCEQKIAEQDRILADPAFTSDYEKIQSAIDRKSELEHIYLNMLEEQDQLEKVLN
ncbi:MAG: ABC-F family ATP-binding cassette domain-containing protein [Candidatus Marinimicrobia bacterium]|nr:ABC-F family ATP-binding cassette domain-containing protein [Candidatus Neomarinimicrobiota bacterium]